MLPSAFLFHFYNTIWACVRLSTAPIKRSGSVQDPICKQGVSRV